MPISKMKLYIWGGSVILLVLLGFGLYYFTDNEINITNTPGATPTPVVIVKSSLTGIECKTGNVRPFAVMVSSDAEARPLSGIGEADWVFEMPVVPNGFTRMMAVFQCGRPNEVGSVRSSRLDFVPLALGMNSIYAHFGGEKEVLAQLNSGVIDNVDGLKYDGSYYFRKKEIPMPHNAFTDFDLLTKISKELNYEMTDSVVVYPHEDKSFSQGNLNPQQIFATGFQVDWKYNKETNSYLRSRSGKAEIDINTNKQVEAKNVIVMKTTWSPISKDYIRVKTIGGGGLLVYKNGTVITGTWEKKSDKSKLTFYDQNHKEISLAKGITWVEIVTTN